jgi:hypothetical protein
MIRLALPLVAVIVLSAVGAQATQQGQATLSNWKLMDVCTKQAQTAYPDYTAASNAKRDAALKACLNANGLPPRQPLSRPEPR